MTGAASAAAPVVIYSAPRGEFDVVSPRLEGELREQGVLIDGETLQVVRRYAVTGVSPEQLRETVAAVFVDPAEEVEYEIPGEGGAGVAEAPAAGVGPVLAGAPAAAGAPVVVPVEYHPGQFDQRADAAEQVLRLLGFADATVRVAEVYVVHTTRDRQQMRDRLVAALVNPVDSQVAQTGGGAEEGAHGGSDDQGSGTGEALPREFHFSDADRAYVDQWFRREGRQPSETELVVLETYWSDHCRHTTFLTALKDVIIEDSSEGGDAVRQCWQWYLKERHRRGEDARPVTLMDLATAMMRWRRADGEIPEVVFSEEVNACTLRVTLNTTGGEQVPWLVLFKNETHNHPTEIEPYGGAATCLGGAIRDPLSGRGYVYQAMRVTGSADPRAGATAPPAGKLLQRTITRGAARGYSSYGNQIGVATGLVDELYHPGYVAKRLEMGAVVGAVPEALVRREEPAPGDLVLLIGGRTGRDGIGGATGSSRSHDRSSLDRAGAEVQKGNPPVERALQRLFRVPEFLGTVKRCNDFGAGGVAVAVGEIARGLEIDLDRVPLKYQGLTATEIAVSESQERMAVVVAPGDSELVIALAAAENLDATVVGKVNGSERLVMRYRGEAVVDIARDFLDSAGVRGETGVVVAFGGTGDAVDAGDGGDAGDEGAPSPTAAPPASAPSPTTAPLALLEERLQDLRYASREGLSEWFDNSIGSGTLLAHCGGRLQRSPGTAMAALLPAELYNTPGSATTATVMAYGCDPHRLAANPFVGAYLAVLESVARLAAAGVSPGREWISLQEYFPRPGDDPRLWGLPLAAMLGALQAQRDLGVTAIGGKDSMSGTFEAIQVPPTVISVALGVCEADRIVPSHAVGPETPILLLYTPVGPSGLPDVEVFRAHRRWLQELRDAGALRAAVPVRGGGTLVALAQMLFGENLGFEGDSLEDLPLQAAGYGSFLVELDREHLDEGPVRDFVNHRYHLGHTTADGVLRLGGEQRAVRELYRLWSAPLEGVFPTEDRSSRDRPAPVEASPRQSAPATRRRPTSRVARPTVVIPVFPGTNCEDDSARAFRDAGARTEVLVLRTRTAVDLEDSIETLARQLKGAQILMLPGGFSAGDEPGGSGKFIAAVMRAPAVRAVVEEHFLDRDRLILGICNGFQGLVRLGLVPYGEYREREPGSCVLAPNRIGRHVARSVLTRVVSSRGPWLAGTSPGDLHSVPVSHGEGRFWCAPELLEKLLSNGQVATQYVDWHGRLRMDRPWNPNGSLAAVEGVLSPDGRVLGKMGHTERQLPGLYRHVPVVGDAKLFESGVAWFK